MLLDDDIYISRLVDEEEFPDMSQEELNAENLFLHDCGEFYKALNNRMYEGTFKYYADALYNADTGFWEKVLIRMIKRYSLNTLLPELATVDKDDKFRDNVLDLVRDIKIKVIDYIIMNKINKSTTKESMLEIMENNIGIFFENFLKNTTDKYYNILLKQIFSELEKEN